VQVAVVNWLYLDLVFEVFLVLSLGLDILDVGFD